MSKTILQLLFPGSFILAFTTLSLAQEGVITIDQPSDIETLLEFKKDLSTLELFKIQVFSGHRADAEKTKSEVENKYPDFPVSLEYNTPNYKIWVGNFRTQLEADRALVKIKEDYTTAFVFNPKQDNEK